MKTSIAFALLLALMSPYAWAVRTVAVMPIHMNTVHGGIVGGVSCVTAGMFNTGFVGFANGGVSYGYHNYTISLRNLSELPQTVNVNIERTSRASAIYSTNQVAPVNTGPTQTMSVATSSAISLAANEARTVVVTWYCSTARCWLTVDGTPKVGSPDTASAANKVCIAIDSQVDFSFIVQQDRGAVIGSIATSSHRNMGYTDHYVEPPPFVQINGGRPF